MPEDKLYFRQWLSGRDFATDDAIASQMRNFVYGIGDTDTREVILVDPAYSVDELLDLAAQDGYTVTGVLATHCHPDHVGGSMMGFELIGISELLDRVDVPIHVNREEAPWVERITGVGQAHLKQHDSGDVVKVGEIEIELIHTPGHTPGSQCFLVEHRLVSGDTLFLDGCGRTDLPGGDPEQMYFSLTQRLGKISNESVLYPGHNYSMAPSAEMGSVREHNYVFAPASVDQWMGAFGGGQ
jgi:glyoxylase-like metal-dependent hydrolase (beta-lactamase superfamily II)